MERNLKRMSDALKLPQESRERIRSQLASYQAQQEDISMKKPALKTRIPLVAAVAVIAAALTLTAAAAAVHLFRNSKIVPSMDDVLADHSADDAPSAVAVESPSGAPPASLEEMTASARFKSDGWASEDTIGGGVISAYHQWDFMEVLSDGGALRVRRVGRADGAKKMEYTAENPADLTDTLTGRVAFDLSWLGEQYDYVPDANLSFVVTDADGSYVSELFSALYAKADSSGYVQLDISNVSQADYFAQSYIIDGSYETAYYYTSADGCEFLIRMNSGRIWADCCTSHACISLYGAYLTSDEVEDIVDNLSLSIDG